MQAGKFLRSLSSKLPVGLGNFHVYTIALLTICEPSPSNKILYNCNLDYEMYKLKKNNNYQCT